jgi:hypothetical protein
LVQVRARIAGRILLVDRGFGDDGAVTDMPWASVFSPTANARALSAIQAEGFRAASQLVDRFVRFIDARAEGRTNGAEPTAAETVDRNGNLDLERLARSWWAMFGQLLVGSAPGMMPARRPPGTLDLKNSEANGHVRLEATESGWAATEVWLHNNGGKDLGLVRLRCSELLAHDGRVIGSAAVQFEPEVVPMPARSSRGVTMKVKVTQHIPTGMYRGTLLVRDHPDVWLPVVLVVHPAVA